MNITWTLSCFISRWQNRIRYLLWAPVVYKNWWAILLPKLGVSVILELRNGLRYLVRAGTTDLSVINEASIIDPYLGNGFDVLPCDADVMDVGANIGDFTMQLAKACPNGRVFALEPIREHVRMISVQMMLNQIDNVRNINVALGNSESELEIHLAGSGSSMTFGNGESQRTRVTTLQKLMEEEGIDRLALLKLDCEGAEWDILPAAEAILPRIQRIYMEFHCDRGWTPEKLAAWLRARGYEVRHTHGVWTGLLWAIRRDLAFTVAERRSEKCSCDYSVPTME